MVLLRVGARWSVAWVWALLVSSCLLSARSNEQEHQGHQPQETAGQEHQGHQPQETGGQEHQGHQPHETGGHQAHHGLDRNMVQDKDHILEHLEGVINKPESEMTNQELQLHYFKMHDYDGNNLLDGLELATAISHVHKEEGGEHSEPMKEEDLISLIDDVLRDDDKNNDGYIDYAEFAKSLG